MNITKQQFNDYEYVREEGRHNMFDVNAVCKLTNLTREQVFFIMKNYSQLKKYFQLKTELDCESNADYLDKEKVRKLEFEIKEIEVGLK